MIIFLSQIGKPNISDDEKLTLLINNINHIVLANAVNVVEVHCAMCHAQNPSWEGMNIPPKGVRLETSEEIIRNIDMVYQQAVLSDAMPPGNLTWMEFSQRESLRRLYNEIVEYRKNGGIWEKLKEIL